MINEEAAMFDSLLMDSYVSSTTGVRPLLRAGLGSTCFYKTEIGQFTSSSSFAHNHAKLFLPRPFCSWSALRDLRDLSLIETP